MKKEIGIYCFENETEKKVYIGQSSNLERRKYSHYHTIKKYQDEFHLNLRENPDLFQYKVLEYCTIDELSSKELYWIDWYKNNTDYSLYNKRRQGFNSRGKTPTEKHIQKVKQGLKEFYSKNPGTMLGKHHSDNTKEIISEKRKEYINKMLADDPEYKNKLAARFPKEPWNKGKKGPEPWNKGKKASEETRKKMSESHKGILKGRKQIVDPETGKRHWV